MTEWLTEPLGHDVWSFLCALHSVCNYFVENCCIYTYQRYWPVIFFFGVVPVSFWYQGNGAFTECLWEYSCLFSLLEEFEKDQYKFFFLCLVEFICEAIWSWTFVCRKFFFFFLQFITDSISLLVIGLFKSSISSWFSFGVLYVSRKLSISYKLSDLLAHNKQFIIFFYGSVCFWDISWNFSFFISYFVYLNCLSFLLGEPG